MPNSTKEDLTIQALMALRDYGVHLSLFRKAVDEWAGHNRNRYGMPQTPISKRRCHTF